MFDNYQDIARALSGQDIIAKLAAKKSAIDALGETPEGQAAREFAEKNERMIMSALESGDTAALSRMLSSFMKTEAGEKLAAEVSNLMEK